VGDPLESRFDIRATYSTQTTTYELLELGGLANANTTQSASAKRRQQVDINMGMSGTLEDPDIELSIALPESGGSAITNDAQAILNGMNDQQIYEQVFSLLVFNSFNAFGGSGGGGGFDAGAQGANLAINSLSNLISNQLNRLADKAISGFDVNIGVESYENQYLGRQNTANVDLSRSLLNDRLTITFGTDVNVGSNTLAGQQQNSAGFQSNFVLTYQLTESGRYFVRVFRRPDYDVISTNTPYENGVGVSYQRKFD
jgi:hypothetical protein